jgi:hypothetical protein
VIRNIYQKLCKNSDDIKAFLADFNEYYEAADDKHNMALYAMGSISDPHYA